MPTPVKLTQPLWAAAADVQAELAYLSGVDAQGHGAAVDWWQSQASFARKWGSVVPGTAGGAITYAFDSSPFWSAADKTIIAGGLALWSAVADIQFTPINDMNAARVLFHYNNDGQAATGTYSYPIGPAGIGAPYIGTQNGATTIFDPAQLNLGYGALGSFTAYGGYGVTTVLHEEGHLLGLGHTGAYNGDANPATQQFGAFDSRQWSLMSYIDPSNQSARFRGSYLATGTDWGVAPGGYPRSATTWMPLDILAAQRLYGVATNTPLSGGQIFGFHCNIAGPIRPFFDFTINQTPVITLWDAGAGNTLDVSGFASAARIDLRPGTFSSVDGLTNNIGIALGTRIDAVVGGPGDDVFVLNGDGNTVQGGAGANQAVLTRGGVFYHDHDGAVRLLTADGLTDALTGVAALTFVGGADTIATDAGGRFALVGGHYLLFLGAAPATVTLGGADTLIGNRGAAAVTALGQAGLPGNLVFAVDAPLLFTGGATRDTVVCGDATVTGGSGGIAAYGTGSRLIFQGGSGYNIAASASSRLDVHGGVGGGLFVGGTPGGNSFAIDGGAGVVFAGGPGDLVTLNNAAVDYVILGRGPETVRGDGNTAGIVVYADSGAAQVTGGAGDDVLAAGSGNDTFAGGGGVNSFLFINGHGGAHVIADWDPSRDYVFLSGFASAAQAGASALASQAQIGGSTIVTLPDHTQITFLHANGLGVGSFY